MSDYLGTLVWYNIGGEEPLPVTRGELARWFEELSLDEAFLPAQPRGVEAFRAATTGLSDEWVSGGIRYRASVRETTSNSEFVLRQLWASWTDENGETQSRRVADLQFFRPRRTADGRQHGTEVLKTMLHRGLEDLDRARLQAIVDRCERAYKAFATRQSTQAIRFTVRRYLIDRLSAVSMRAGGGGTYFVPPEHHETVRALAQLVRRCGPQCRMLFTPVVNEPEQRDMIRESVEQDVEARVDSLLRTLDEWRTKNAGKHPSVELLGNWGGEQVNLADLMVTYGDLLDATFERAPDRLEELGAAIAGMQAAAAQGLRR